jgi:hypothetical protein
VLLDAGSGTPAALRYAIKDKTKRKVSLTLTMGLPDAKPTAKKMAWTYDLKRDGDGFRIAMKITAADPPLKGLKGTWAVSARGRQAAPTSEKSAQQLLVGTQAAHLMPQFPEAPVGVGARWTAPVSVVAGVGVGEVPGTTTWELVAVDGTAVTVRGALEVHAKDFMFRDTKMDLDVTATFETHLDLTTYVGEGKMEMELTGTPEGGQAIAYASTLDLILK